jgi:hypothetical protein
MNVPASIEQILLSYDDRGANGLVPIFNPSKI